jgi:Protein of unknown function (DUF3048) N-terminal domain/Protein of unknown function (DUF3048) C-terminal domain
MPTRAGRPRLLVACLLPVAMLAAACSGDKPTAPPASSTTSTTTAAPTPTPTGPVPLTGGPVLAVKIDNTYRARPRIGLDQPDVVYVEPVEGGLTRLLAVFSRHLPKEVGPVRSGRESDVDLVANYGRVALAFSGSSSYTARILDKGKQVNLSFDRDSRGYRRDRSRPAPYNVIGDTKALLARAGGSVKPRDVGFRYGEAAPGGTPAAGVTASWPSSTVSLRWDAGRKQYLVTTDRRADKSPKGVQYGATTVVVQYVTTRKSRNRDVNGQATPVVTVVGKGRADVLRDGKVWHGSWSRSGVTAPTAFTSGSTRLTFAPTGTVWVLLVAPGQRVTVR